MNRSVVRRATVNVLRRPLAGMAEKRMIPRSARMSSRSCSSIFCRMPRDSSVSNFAFFPSIWMATRSPAAVPWLVRVALYFSLRYSAANWPV